MTRLVTVLLFLAAAALVPARPAHAAPQMLIYQMRSPSPDSGDPGAPFLAIVVRDAAGCPADGANLATTLRVKLGGQAVLGADAPTDMGAFLVAAAPGDVFVMVPAPERTGGVAVEVSCRTGAGSPWQQLAAGDWLYVGHDRTPLLQSGVEVIDGVVWVNDLAAQAESRDASLDGVTARIGATTAPVTVIAVPSGEPVADPGRTPKTTYAVKVPADLARGVHILEFSRGQDRIRVPFAAPQSAANPSSTAAAASAGSTGAAAATSAAAAAAPKTGGAGWWPAVGLAGLAVCLVAAVLVGRIVRRRVSG